MPRILIAGCGYVGQAVADLFFQAGWATEGWTSSARSAEKLSSKPYPVRPVDVSVCEQVAGNRSEFDTLLFCASSRGGGAEDYWRIYWQGARNLLEVFPGATLLFTSSTSVYAQKDADWVTENSPAESQGETARILRETEELVLSRGGLVARLAGIYGPGRSFLLRSFLAGKAVIELENDRYINQAHRDDIAAALFLMIKRRHDLNADGGNARIFNVADDSPSTRRACYEWLAQQLERPVPPLANAAAFRRRGDSNKRVSNAKLRSLGWAPRFPTFQAGMTASVLPHYDRCGA